MRLSLLWLTHCGLKMPPPQWVTVYPKKYAHGFCFAVLCCGYTWTDFPISIRLTSLALWQSNDCPSASKATLMDMDKYFMWIHYERLHNHNKAKHNKTVCIFLGIYCNGIQHYSKPCNDETPLYIPIAEKYQQSCYTIQSVQTPDTISTLRLYFHVKEFPLTIRQSWDNLTIMMRISLQRK